MLPLTLLTSLLVAVVSAHDHPAGHVDGVIMTASPTQWTTIYLSQGLTTTMVLPVPGSSTSCELILFSSSPSIPFKLFDATSLCVNEFEKLTRQTTLSPSLLKKLFKSQCPPWRFLLPLRPLRRGRLLPLCHRLS